MLAAILVLVLAPAGARAADSNAPPGAPPHWLPGAEWVREHWIPYDEGRLYALLHVTRGDLWRQLRDDTRNVAQLAARHGWPDPRALAKALVAPRAAHLTSHRLATLRARALDTLTQGHLAQHLFFHSLHEWAVPASAPQIFGTPTVAEFRDLRRAELSPVMICHLNGRSLAQTQGAVFTKLRQQAQRGVRGGDTTAAQMRLLLSRQLAQVPRWLMQTRYNGPPPLYRSATAVKRMHVYGNDAVVAADGRHVVFDSYRVNPKQAKVPGEITMVIRDLQTGRSALVRRPLLHDGKPNPASIYNPAVSADGRFVAYERSLGNLNFAKRYGRIRVLRRDTRTGLDELVSLRGESGYAPSISADGRHVAFESAHAGSVPGAYRIRVYVRDLASDRLSLVGRASGSGGAVADGDVYEPRISADGRHVVFTSVAHNLGHGRAGGLRARVYVRDLRSGSTALVSRADGVRGAPADADAYEPRISADGRHVVFTSQASNLGGGSGGRGGMARVMARVYVRDLSTGSTALASRGAGAGGPPADRASSQGAISADGRYATFISGAGNLVPGVHGSSLVYRRDLRSGTTALVSRASGATGVAADGTAAQPSISADGQIVSFTADATDLGRHGGRVRAVYVRDVAQHRTSLVGPPVAPGEVRTPSGGSRRWPAALALIALLALAAALTARTRRRRRGVTA